VKRTFVDAGVLIAAARGGNVQAARAMEILDDPEREFAASVFLQLEVLPQAVFNKRQHQTGCVGVGEGSIAVSFVHQVLHE
jgi:hypothetical protein